MIPFKVGEAFVWLDKDLNRMDYPERIGTTGVIKSVFRLNSPDYWQGERVEYAVDIENDEDGIRDFGLYTIRFGKIFKDPEWEV